MPAVTPTLPRKLLPHAAPVVLACALALGGCTQIPTSGPSTEDLREGAAREGTPAVQVVDIDDRVLQRLQASLRQPKFSETLGATPARGGEIGPGDSIEVSIWEAPPATLFGGGTVDTRQPAAARPTTLPEQVVDREGFVTVPFAGRVNAAGQTLPALEAEIARRLRGKANQPEVVVRLMRNASATVTVVGEVANSVRMPLTPVGERLLDALAAAGGVRQPIGKTTVQLTRGKAFHSLPLDLVVRDPAQNVPLQPGDVLTLLFQPLSFTALGATGRNEEVPFEGQGISLAQALARAGGLQDSRADAQGVFIFRMERPEAVALPAGTTPPAAAVPVVYRLDLRQPASFFLMQHFAISNRDVVYVSNAPAAELQKFLNLVFSVAYPVINTIQLTR